MKKKHIVRSNIYFNQIIKNGMKIQNKYFIIYYLNKEEISPKFGFAVGKKLGNAVTRNKIKRQLRNITNNQYVEFKENKDYIIVAKKFCLDTKYDTLLSEMKNLIRNGE